MQTVILYIDNIKYNLYGVCIPVCRHTLHQTPWLTTLLTNLLLQEKS